MIYPTVTVTGCRRRRPHRRWARGIIIRGDRLCVAVVLLRRRSHAVVGQTGGVQLSAWALLTCFGGTDAPWTSDTDPPDAEGSCIS